MAPYNTFYPELEEHMKEVGVESVPNRWNEPIALGLVDPHDSMSHPAGVSDCQAESATCLETDQFTNFLVSLCYFLQLNLNIIFLCVCVYTHTHK